MTAPVQPFPQEDYYAKAKQLRDAGVPLPEIDAYLTAKLGTAGAGGHENRFHAEYQSGALGKRMASQNAREAATVADEEDAQPSVIERIAAHAADVAQGIPGLEALEAGVGSGVSHLTSHPMGYTESLSALRDATGRIPVGQRVVEQIVGGLPVAGLLGEAAAASRLIGPLTSAAKAIPKVGSFVAGRIPGAISGAAYGGLRGATEADPDANRLRDTALGAAAGGVIGSVLPASVQRAPGALARAVTKTAADADAGVNVLRQLGSEAEPTVAQQTVQAARSMGTPARDAARQRVLSAVRKQSIGPRAAPAEPPTLDAQMQAMFEKVRGGKPAVRGPSPRGDEWTDAELAMGLDQPPQDLLDALQRSIEAKGGVPVVPRSL